MSRAALAPGVYGFDDVEAGDWLTTGLAEVTAQVIDAFAAVSGDRFEIHMDDAAAARHGFSGRVAHGLLVLALTDGLKNQAAARFRAQASLGWDWAFRAPVLADDSVTARIEVAEKRAVRSGDRGILTLAFATTNQRGEVVQDGTNKLMVYR